jgi:hypothetical protein
MKPKGKSDAKGKGAAVVG